MSASLELDLVPLRVLAVGQTARVAEMVGRPEDLQRLKELGLCKGVTIEMVQPGNPCIIRFAGGKFCLRNDDLLGVLIDLGSCR